MIKNYTDSLAGLLIAVLALTIAKQISADLFVMCVCILTGAIATIRTRT